MSFNEAQGMIQQKNFSVSLAREGGRWAKALCVGARVDRQLNYQARETGDSAWLQFLLPASRAKKFVAF